MNLTTGPSPTGRGVAEWHRGRGEGSIEGLAAGEPRSKAINDYQTMIHHCTAPVLTVAVALGLVLLVGCGDSGVVNGQTAQRQVRGQVVEVIPRNISEVETLRLRDDQGMAFTFSTDAFVGFTPSHLREHQLFGQSVLVTFLQKGDRLIAVKITD